MPDPRAGFDRLRDLLGGERRFDDLVGSDPHDLDGQARHALPTPVRRAPVAGLVALALVAALVGGVTLWRSRPVGVTIGSDPAAAAALGAPSASLPASPGAGPAATTSVTAPAQVVVHVVGRVRRPGLITLPAGSRVADAVDAAGGLLPRTDPQSVNLARPLVDGEQLVVGVSPAAGSSTTGSSTAAPAGPGVASAGGLLDLNTATLEQLQDLPGVGPVLAQRILDWRTRNGRFASVDDLREVAGIGAKKFADIAPKVRV